MNLLEILRASARKLKVEVRKALDCSRLLSMARHYDLVSNFEVECREPYDDCFKGGVRTQARGRV